MSEKASKNSKTMDALKLVKNFCSNSLKIDLSEFKSEFKKFEKDLKVVLQKKKSSKTQAFNNYVKFLHKQNKTKKESEKIPFKQMSTYISNKWKKLSDKDKAKFETFDEHKESDEVSESDEKEDPPKPSESSDEDEPKSKKETSHSDSSEKESTPKKSKKETSHSDSEKESTPKKSKKDKSIDSDND